MGEKQPNFEELLLPHLDGAYNFARWLIENDQDAQAIVEEAYLQARQEFGNFRGADTRAWLITIVRKVAHTWIQKRKEHSKMIPFEETFRGELSAARLKLGNSFLMVYLLCSNAWLSLKTDRIRNVSLRVCPMR